MPGGAVGLVGSSGGGGVVLIGVGLVSTEVETRFVTATFFAADLPDTFAAAGFFLVAAFVASFRLAAATGLGFFPAALTGFRALAAFTGLLFAGFLFAGAAFLSECLAPDIDDSLFEAVFFLAAAVVGLDFEAAFFLAIN